MGELAQKIFFKTMLYDISSFQNQHRKTELTVLFDKEMTSIFPFIAKFRVANWLYKHHGCCALNSEIFFFFPYADVQTRIHVCV